MGALFGSSAGQLRVNTVHEKGSGRYTQQDSLEDSGGTCFTLGLLLALISPPLGGNLNAASRQALMQKLARTESSSIKEETM
jgi:RNA-binding protein 39